MRGATKRGRNEKTKIAESIKNCRRTMKRPQIMPTRTEAGT